MNNDQFYEALPVEVLEEFAAKTFGDGVPSDLDMILKFLKPSQSILEVGCGTGRLGLALVKKGFGYTGIDKQKRYLAIFREHLQELPCTLLEIDFVDLPANKKYDVILFSWTVIGDFSKDEQEEVLKKTYDLLNEGGICLIDNPSENQEYNKLPSYNPTPFYYKDWKKEFEKLGFYHDQKIYKTKIGVERELVILSKISLKGKAA